MKVFLLISICFFAQVSLQAQHPPQRYRDQIFDDVTRTKNIFYGDGPSHKRAMLDIYTPVADSQASRPVIVLMHGGGFKFGSKNVSRMKIWGRRFARMGYVVAAINYRLSKKKPLSRFPDLAEGCIEGMEDVSKAVDFLRAHAKEYVIDPSKVVLGGHSAGGMIALQSVYSSASEIRELIKKGEDGVGSTRDASIPHNLQKIAAVINFWGAVYDTSWLQNARVPIVAVHGSKDRVVPANFNGSPIFGSIAIHRAAGRAGVPVSLKLYEGKGHELQKHFNPLYAGPIARKRWRQAADFAAGFLYDQIIQ